MPTNYHTDWRMAEKIAEKLCDIATAFVSPDDVLSRVKSKEQLAFYYYWLIRAGKEKVK